MTEIVVLQTKVNINERFVKKSSRNISKLDHELLYPRSFRYKHELKNFRFFDLFESISKNTENSHKPFIKFYRASSGLSARVFLEILLSIEWGD